MSKEVKVKILDMTYEQDNNLFQMHIEELVGDHKQVVLAISGNDFGISKEVPIDLVEIFCKEMIGKEKNLHIERDPSIINEDMVKNAPVEAMHRALEQTIGYPIDEVANSINSKPKDNGDGN